MKKKGGLFTGLFGGIVCLVLFAVAGYKTYQTLTTADQPTPRPTEAVFMCAETGKTFIYAVKEGDRWPVRSPYTHKLTGYPTEKCYWTKDGKRKLEPSYVILNEHLGKPGDTICPDCGRIVVGHNPPPPASVPLATEAGPASSPAAAPSPAAQPGGAQPEKPRADGGPSAGEGGADPPPTEAMIYATIRAKMQEMIDERARMLREKHPPTADLRRLEVSILRAKGILTTAGEVVPPIDPPITQTPDAAD